MAEVFMPRLDPGMQSGKIVEWLKKEGDEVQKGEALLVVEGEKTTFEVEAPEGGVLTKILFSPGTDVQVSQAVAIIGEPGGPVPSPTGPALAQPEFAPAPKPARVAAVTERIVASPAARRLAQEHRVDISKVTGTGPGGRITREDVLAVAQKAEEVAGVPAKVGKPTVLRSLKLEGIRKTVAERLGYSARTAVPVTLTTEADASKLVTLKDRGDRVGFTAFAVKAVAKALEQNNAMNSTIEGEEIIVYSDINVAVAIHTDEGLVAPVVKDANRKSPKEIDAEIQELSKKAKENRLTIQELTGGTFTVTNLGAYDIESFAPVINPPQCGILGLGRIAYKPTAVGERIIAKPLTLLTLVFDHRIVDGVPAAKFLRDVKRKLEDAESLL